MKATFFPTKSQRKGSCVCSSPKKHRHRDLRCHWSPCSLGAKESLSVCSPWCFVTYYCRIIQKAAHRFEWEICRQSWHNDEKQNNAGLVHVDVIYQIWRRHQWRPGSWPCRSGPAPGRSAAAPASLSSATRWTSAETGGRTTRTEKLKHFMHVCLQQRTERTVRHRGEAAWWEIINLTSARLASQVVFSTHNICLFWKKNG